MGGMRTYGFRTYEHAEIALYRIRCMTDVC